MTISFADIDQLLILIDVDDPATYDPVFQNLLEFGGFTKDYPLFNDENREVARSMDGKLTAKKFIIELYTDRFHDFVYKCLKSDTHYRALIFRCVNIAPFDDDEDSDLEDVQFIYELKTLNRRKANDKTEVNDDDLYEEDVDTDTDDEVPTEQTHFSSPKLIH